MRFAAVLGLGLLLAATSRADEVEFAAPVRLQAGEGRTYPSPALFDLNGDGRLDLIVGDLFGKVTVAYGYADGFTVETDLSGREGKPLKFNNW